MSALAFYLFLGQDLSDFFFFLSAANMLGELACFWGSPVSVSVSLPGVLGLHRFALGSLFLYGFGELELRSSHLRNKHLYSLNLESHSVDHILTKPASLQPKSSSSFAKLCFVWQSQSSFRCPHLYGLFWY